MKSLAQQQTLEQALGGTQLPDLSVFNSPRPTVVYTPDPALDATATAALQGQNPTSIQQGRQYATRAYKKPDGTYGVLPFNPGTAASSPHGPISGLPGGTTNAALLHTHGANDPGYDNEHFSGEDIRNAWVRDVLLAAPVEPGAELVGEVVLAELLALRLLFLNQSFRIAKG